MIVSMFVLSSCKKTPLVYYEGLAAVKQNGAWGYVDTLKNVVIPYQYDSAGHFSDGVAIVRIDRKIGAIDKTGASIIPCKYDSIGCFIDSMAIVGESGKYGFVDITGKEVIPLIYDTVENFMDGWTTVRQNGETFRIDRNGEKPKLTVRRIFGVNHAGNVTLEGDVEGNKLSTKRGIENWFDPKLEYVEASFSGGIQIKSSAETEYVVIVTMGEDVCYKIILKMDDKKYEMKITIGMQLKYENLGDHIVILFDESYCKLK